MTEARARVLGAVLAGGASSRFGAPKWRVPVAGQTMGARAVAALAPSCARVVAISSDPAVAELGVEVRPDVESGQGPLGGIRTALSWARELSLEGAIVLACDLPLVSAPVVRALFDEWQEEDTVVPEGAGGAEPLCAIYAIRILPIVEAALAAGELSPSRLLRELHPRRLSLERARRASGFEDPFLNVNTKETCAMAEELLREQVQASTTALATPRGPHHM
jgi:molybdopterin-guanine dinucleotide biosynthesis protein A